MEVEIVIVDQLIQAIHVFPVVRVGERIAKRKIHLLILILKRILKHALEIAILTHHELTLSWNTLPLPVIAGLVHRAITSAVLRL